MSEFQSLKKMMLADKQIQERLAKHGADIPLTHEEKQQRDVDDFNAVEGHRNEEDGYDCPKCKNRGYVFYLKDGYATQGNCDCVKIRRTLKRAKESGLGNIITEFTFKKFNDTEEWQKQMKAKAMDFCKDDNAKWFYIGGQVGSGKTHICTAISAHYIKASYDVKYMLWCEESKTLKALVNDPRYTQEIEQYKTVDVLYIDDFLKVQQGENPTPADIKLAFEIINHRLLYDDKITVISSEKMLDELMEYDEATMSRIYQQAGDYKLSVGRDKKRNYRLRGNTAI